MILADNRMAQQWLQKEIAALIRESSNAKAAKSYVLELTQDFFQDYPEVSLSATLSVIEYFFQEINNATF